MPRRSPVLVLGICAALLTSAGSAVAAPLHDSRIVGGQEATREYAHQVSLEVAGFGCGGTLVTPTKVVTAAHCVFDANGTPYTADQINMRIGTHDISGDEGDAYTAAAVAAHPDYDPVTVVYDAAVITLPEAATQAPLPLIASGDAAIDAPGVTATVIGWGRTSETGDGSEILREVELPVRTEAECADGVGGYDPTVMICAGVLEGGKDSCQGDSGGPLLLPDGSPDGFVLGGIVSFGNGCARPGQLGAYTRLRQSKVTRWVRDRLGFPTAAARASTTTPRAGDLVTLTSESVHPAGTAGLTVNWDLDSDGDADATGKSVTTRFPTAGRKEITYLVEDAQGDSDVGSLVLTVGAAGGRSDFNGDGFSDLAVGVPGEDGATVDGGAVHIQYGSATGLVTTGAQALTMSSPNVAGTTEGDERFGTAVAAGDLNGDGFDDLAVGAPGDKVGTAAAAGSVVVLYGSRTGLSGTGSRLLTQGATYGDVAEADDGFGSALAITDLGKSVHDDLAIGVPQENGGAGLVHVLSGSATGLSAGRQVWTQTALGANPTEAGDNFGAALAAANFGKSAHGDLAIGVPLENGAVTDHGAVHVVYGTANGLTAADDAVFTQNTASVPGTDQAGDRFGAALAAADLASGAQADLAAGAPGKTVAGLAGAGSVIVLPGSATGLTGTASHERHQDTEGMLDAAEAGDGFGSALAAGDIGGGTKADLAVGAPGESVAGKAGAGQVAVLYGSTSTVLATGNQVFHQDSTGVLDAVEIGDEFGATLAAGNYGKTSKGDLVVGVPSEDIGTGLTDAGAIGVLYGGTTGALSSAGNQFLHQDTTNLPDASEVGDGFGKGLG